MKEDKLFPNRKKINPTIYAYELIGVDSHIGLLKIGYTNRDVKTRVAEQLGTSKLKYKIVLEEPAMCNDGTVFTDHDVHKLLKHGGFINTDGEWFKCIVDDVKNAIVAVRDGKNTISERVLDFPMRPEQQAALEKTTAYFNSFNSEEHNKNKTPHFLWNCKMRFGKTFTSYQLAVAMKWKKILVLTFKPAVESAWQEDLRTHKDFESWQFISKKSGLSYDKLDENRPFVCFGSFQDYLGKNSVGSIKTKNKWVHTINWDCIIFDEYHYGAWRENAKDLFKNEDEKEQDFLMSKDIDKYDEEIMPITANAYLYLSGTPFRAIATGEFIEEQIYNWTYSDEQMAKENWKGDNNPYASLPKMVMLTYQMPSYISDIAKDGEFDEFDLNIFFSADGEKDNAQFTYKDEVQKWLDLIRGGSLETTIDNLKLGAKKPPLPFSHAPLLKTLTHTFWFLPFVSSCYAMKNLISEPQNKFYHDYNVIVVAGAEAGIGLDALEPVRKAMDNPMKTKTITLSCGKLTAGVSIKPWTAIFMLRNCSSPETYFQAAFRVQTPWTIKNTDQLSPNKEEVIKEVCYVFDFAPNRALSQVADYSCRLNIDEENIETKVEEFIRFLPILAYDGSSMKDIDAKGVLEMAYSGTSATLLARRWESALLVNVDNTTLQRLMNNEDAMKALMSIEGFRSLNKDIEVIINKSESIKKIKQEANEKELNQNQKKKLSKDEKEYKRKRQEIQKKLIKLATRIPVFMYLTDYREYSLKDIITQLEPLLFKKVTGISKKDFEILVSIGVFNSVLMNDAVYKFKRYEDSSLVYTGINRNPKENVGGYDSVITKEEHETLYGN